MMNKKTGISITQDGDLMVNVTRDTNALIVSGVVIGHTLYQNQFILLNAQKGDIKEYPLMGAGIEDIANDEGFDFWQKSIREELARDGMIVETLVINSDGLTIKADYK